MEVLRYDLLNYLIDEYNYQDYLEIGVGQGDCLRAVKAKNKDAVENGLEGITPPEVTHRMSSDEFFEQNTKKYDLIFIDGGHSYKCCKNDFNNIVRFCNKDTIIVIDDTCGKKSYSKGPRKVVDELLENNIIKDLKHYENYKKTRHWSEFKLL